MLGKLLVYAPDSFEQPATTSIKILKSTKLGSWISKEQLLQIQNQV